VHVGLTLMLSDRTVSITEAAPAVEERGFESLWVGEHTHLPVATVHHYTRGRYGTGTTTRDGYVPDFYRRFPDPYVTLTAAALCTSTLRLGTCIALPAEHNPLILAKVIATLDQLAGGRFAWGIGYGWNPLEMRNNGFDRADRREVMAEKIAAVRQLWTQETAEADGRFVRFTESWSYPKPAQAPHPPILLGAAATEANVEDLVAWADGWIPVRSFFGDDLEGGIDRVRRRLAEAGRDASPAGFPITIMDPTGSTAGKRSHEAFEACIPDPAALDAYRELGVARLNLGVPVTDRSELLWALDRLAATPHLLAP
jgi:probable F420-dependent oxidoreductase